MLLPRSRALVASFFVMVVLAACGDDEDLPPGPEATPAAVLATELAGVPHPADNPPNPAKVELGRMLYWDPILSGGRDVSCGSCHDPAFGYSDGRRVSVGTAGHVTPRGALTVLDTAWNGWTPSTPRPDPTAAPMFWDSRARSLEAQARASLVAEGEMRGTSFGEAGIFPELVRRLEEVTEYVERFDAAFGGPVIDETAIVRAIATFERTLVTVPSYERWLAGEEDAISERAKRGTTATRSSPSWRRRATATSIVRCRRACRAVCPSAAGAVRSSRR